MNKRILQTGAFRADTARFHLAKGGNQANDTPTKMPMFFGLVLEINIKICKPFSVHNYNITKLSVDEPDRANKRCSFSESSQL